MMPPRGRADPSWSANVAPVEAGTHGIGIDAAPAAGAHRFHATTSVCEKQ